MKATTTLRTMQEIVPEIESAKKELNDAVTSNDFAGVTKGKESLTSTVKEFNKAAAAAAYLELLKTECPMRAALDQPTYPTKKVTENVEDDGKHYFTVDDTASKIDILALARMGAERSGFSPVGSSPDFAVAIENLLYLFVVRAFKGILKNMPKNFRETYRMSKLCREYDKDSNVTSNSSMVAEVQSVVDKMYFVASEKDAEKNTYKVTKHEVAYIENLILNKGKGVCTLRVASVKDFADTMMQALNHLVIGTEFGFEQKKGKKDQAKA